MRAPDFLIVGAMKAGSTSLWRWLGSHPDVALPVEKEPNFFSDERVWRRGEEWYRSLFPPQGLTGEGSVGYADPAVAARAAARAKRVAPNARLLFLARDPVERMRSHYRHEVLRGRERRSFDEVVASGGGRYARLSCYAEGLAPWREQFGDAALRVLRFDALVGEGAEGWHEALSFLGLDDCPRPAERHNVSAAKTGFTPLMRVAWEAGLSSPARLAPPWLRRVLRPFFLRTSETQKQLLASSQGQVPEALRAQLAGADV